MNRLPVRQIVLCILMVAFPASAEVKVAVEHVIRGGVFEFASLPRPAGNDAASRASFSLVTGTRDRNGGRLEVLQDGRLPSEEDQPWENFFFAAGTAGGRIRIDLGGVLPVKEVRSYSWHRSTRGPQVYRLYGADGSAEGFKAEPAAEQGPESCGWRFLAEVDTRPGEAEGGGQHGVVVREDEGGVLGTFRYLLLDVRPTETRDPFGHTFYSEIDVVEANGPALSEATAGAGEPVLFSFQAEEGRYHFTVDATAAPDLREWAERELKPVVEAWYPKIVTMLPSEGFVAPTNITLRFRNDMGGTPASAGGARINMNSAWFRRELDREARGSVVHEMVHVVQSYGRSRRGDSEARRTPGWLVEGMADYIRWFLFEPETRGAEITGRNLDRARYDASYRITGNFLNWVTERHDRDLVGKLNAAAREGRYHEELWEEWTGQTLAKLGEAWKEEMASRLSGAGADRNGQGQPGD